MAPAHTSSYRWDKLPPRPLTWAQIFNPDPATDHRAVGTPPSPPFDLAVSSCGASAKQRLTFATERRKALTGTVTDCLLQPAACVPVLRTTPLRTILTVTLGPSSASSDSRTAVVPLGSTSFPWQASNAGGAVAITSLIGTALVRATTGGERNITRAMAIAINPHPITSEIRARISSSQSRQPSTVSQEAKRRFAGKFRHHEQ